MRVCTSKTEVKVRPLKAGEVVMEAYSNRKKIAPMHLRLIVKNRKGELHAYDFNGVLRCRDPEYLTTENYNVIDGCFVIEGED